MSTPLTEIISGYTSFGWAKPTAVRLACQDRLHSNQSRGHGNAARRRQAWLAAQAETAAWFDHIGRLSEQDVDNLASANEGKLWLMVQEGVK